LVAKITLVEQLLTPGWLRSLWRETRVYNSTLVSHLGVGKILLQTKGALSLIAARKAAAARDPTVANFWSWLNLLEN
jgi:hypothetical protein